MSKVTSVTGEVGEVYTTSSGMVTIDEVCPCDSVSGYPPVGTEGWRQNSDNSRTPVFVSQRGHSFRFWRES